MRVCGLTSAFEIRRYRVVLGGHNLERVKRLLMICPMNTIKDIPQPWDHYEARIRSVRLHSRYNRITYNNDFAVIELGDPAIGPKATISNLTPICLRGGDGDTDSEEGLPATLAGWGLTEAGEQSLVLQEVNLTTLSDADCRAAFPTGAITPSMLCAWGREDDRTTGDSCAGDSGGKDGSGRGSKRTEHEERRSCLLISDLIFVN